MLFTDWRFFAFFIVLLIIYWNLTDNRLRKGILLIGSAFFYSMWDWRFLGLVAVVIVNTYVVTLLVARSEKNTLRRGILTAGISLSLGVLGFFKYFNFFEASFARLFGDGALELAIVLPVGISFYTFHSISYMVDTFRRRIEPTRNIGDVALYILFFPQLVAGPIVRATDLLPQMRSARHVAADEARFFLVLFLVGYFKKAVVSDNVARYVDLFFANPGHYTGSDGAIAVVFYAIQIYCDFSGYTDMAIAAAGLLGYQLRPNFAHPYLASNLIDFWRRWHISLSSWLRDYLYIPLGGNRGSFLYQARNILITMVLGGLWHGASWTFVAWGALHGFGLILNRAYFALVGRADPERYTLAGNAITFLWVCFAWIFFRATTFQNAWDVLSSFGALSRPTIMAWPSAVATIGGLAVLHVMFYRLDLRQLTRNVHRTVFAAGYGGAIALVLPLVNVNVRPFIYFQF
jgi:alginate O-acetyltransferase complex protein AlgI